MAETRVRIPVAVLWEAVQAAGLSRLEGFVAPRLCQPREGRR
jgi:hypothetical protein